MIRTVIRRGRVLPNCLGLWLAAFGCVANAAIALEYQTNEELSRQLKKLAEQYPDIVRVESLARSLGRQTVWLVELGKGTEEERRQRPGMLLVAGIEGTDVAGTASALAWVGQLAAGYKRDEAIRPLLDTRTIYVVPRLNPDAAESFFAKPQVEATVARLPVDDDHDGFQDEDGPEDLNADGRITWMRVEDPEGDHVLDPKEPRLLLKADRAKGERGAWRLLTEGRDNDQDEAWNEDGPGGVNFNRNFPYNFKFFAPGSGVHPVSEAETKALADFVVAHPNIGIVFTFGLADNLVRAPKSEPGGKRLPTAIHEDDRPYYEELGKAWREALGLKKELDGASEPGTFSDWMYFHRGRLSLAARAWSPALQLERGRAESKEDAGPPRDEKAVKGKEARPGADPGPAAAKDGAGPKPATDNRNESERAFLQWLDQNAPEQFVPWKEIQHPDFPGQKVEIGGFAPFATSAPPAKLLGEWAGRHAKFLTDLAGRLPRIGIRKAEARHLGESVYEIRIQVENNGYLPTSLAQGRGTREVHPTRVVLDLESQAFLSGAKTTRLDPIAGSGGMEEVRCVIHAQDRKQVTCEVISMLGGSVRAVIPLQEGK